MSRQLNLSRLEDRLTPAIATWDGGGTNNLWSTPANWVGDVSPQPGDDLVFGVSAQTMIVNNFTAGTAFGSITLANVVYQISGNAIALAAGINANTGANLSFDVALSAAQAWTLDSGAFIGRIDLNGHVLTVVTPNAGGGGGQLPPPPPPVVTFFGVIQGQGGLIKEGVGRLSLSADNTFIGPIDHRAGILNFAGNSSGGASAPGNQTFVGPGAVLSAGANLIIPEPIVFADSLPTNFNQLIVNTINTTTFSGPLTLNGASRWLGEIVVGGGLFGFGSLSVQGSLTFPAGVTSTYNGFLNAETRFFLFNGTGPTGLVTANDSQRISGNGAIGPLTVQGQTRFAPGDGGIGILTTGNLIEGAFYDAEISAAGNDKVVVNGTATIGGTLNVIPLSGFTPPAGSVFRIIDNDGTDPIAGAFNNLPQGAQVTAINGVPLFVNYSGGTGNDVELTTTQPPPPPGPRPFFSVGAGAGGGPQVNVYNEAGTLVRAFFAYEAAFTGGVHVATADMNGDGVRDVITAPGFGGGPVIRVWDGVTGALLNQFLAYDEAFRGGVFVAAARINSDSFPEIITGAGPTGGPHVKVFNAGSNNVLVQFMAYDLAFTGGVSVGGIDSFLDSGSVFVPGVIITGAGPGGGPHVKTFDGGAVTSSYFAYEASFRGGVFVAGGRFPGLTQNDARGIIVGPGAGRQPLVKVFDTAAVERASFLAYDPAFQGGVTVAGRTLTGGAGEVVTGAGPGGGPHVKELQYPGFTQRNSFFAFDPSFLGGVFVG